MSSIYIQEPSTSGKVLLKTSVGDIDIELWSRECPRACRNFIQLCMEGYYNNTIFHRVVKGFIVQGGDPQGDGTGGESIYGQPFKDEFHSRLRYTRRGLVGMANSDKDDNESQFFFTLAPTPELQNKNTLFGKVTGDTLFNMLKLEEGLVDHNERPLYPHRIIKCEILNNPFNDIIPRELTKGKRKEKKQDKKEKPEGIKNFGLLSFGEEAEEDEEETNLFVQKNFGKPKSLHDVVDDPKLSKDVIKVHNDNEESDSEEDKSKNIAIIKKEELNEKEIQERKQRIRDKLKGRLHSPKITIKLENNDMENDGGIDDDDVLLIHQEEKAREMVKKKEEIRREIITLKKQYQNDRKVKDELLENNFLKTSKEKAIKKDKDIEDNELIKQFVEEKEKYENIKSKMPLKGSSREQFTLSLLTKFRNKLDALKRNADDEMEQNATYDNCDEIVIEKEIQGDGWLRHTLKFHTEAPVLAKDASTKSDDWYDVYDPRNPLNKRKRKQLDDKAKLNKRGR